MIEWDSIRFVLRFAFHVVLGSMIFAFVAVSAIALHWGMDRILDGVGGSAYIRTAIEAVELFIFAVDLVCVVAFIIKEAWVLLKSLLPDPDTPSAA